MDRKDLERFALDVDCKYRIALRKETSDSVLYDVLQLALMVECDTASEPEKQFADSVVDILLQNQIKMSAGWMDEEEYDEFVGEDTEAKEELGIEIFVNPKNLFFNGKVRPDMVIRNGKGNYIVFEVDSFQFHSNQRQLTADKIRERKIQSLGYPVFRFSAKEILDSGGWGPAMEVYQILDKNGWLKKRA